MDLLTIASSGIGYADYALAANRVALGLFFAISGYHKLFNAKRHAALVETLKEDKIPFINFNQWWVPSVEFVGGALLAVGVFSTLCAFLLGGICLVATCMDGLKRVRAYEPVDFADFVDDLLYLPEVLYGLMLLIVIFAGPGAFRVL